MVHEFCGIVNVCSIPGPDSTDPDSMEIGQAITEQYQRKEKLDMDSGTKTIYHPILKIWFSLKFPEDYPD